MWTWSVQEGIPTRERGNESRKLDEAVLDAYGRPHDVGDEEILGRLLALNMARSGS